MRLRLQDVGASATEREAVWLRRTWGEGISQLGAACWAQALAGLRGLQRGQPMMQKDRLHWVEAHSQSSAAS